jgi:hypothetical protein
LGLQLAVMLSCLFLLVISTANGYISWEDFSMVKAEAQALDRYLAATSFSESPTGVIAASFYQISLKIYGLFEPVLKLVSGDRDAITYPLLLLFFGFFFFLAAKRFDKQAVQEQGLLYFTLAYLFFWLILSTGIVWYGLPVLLVLTALVFWSALRQGNAGNRSGKWTLYLFYGVVAAYVLMGFANRISNLKLNILTTDKIAGKRLYNPSMVKYQTGDFTETDVFNSFYLEIGKALQAINAENTSLIYNVGTRFGFFIRDNDKRIYKDNQLDLFNQLMTKYPYKERITAMLKASGFRYIMVDFNTPSGDKTPEKTLVSRFQNFMLLLQSNPALELVATDRVIKETLNGQTRNVYGVFGEILSPGSYAVFRIK